jgi:hypothetical protein
VIRKMSIANETTERLDTCFIQVIYRIANDDYRLYVGQHLDVFIDAALPAQPSAETPRSSASEPVLP